MGTFKLNGNDIRREIQWKFDKISIESDENEDEKEFQIWMASVIVIVVDVNNWNNCYTTKIDGTKEKKKKAATINKMKMAQFFN